MRNIEQGNKTGLFITVARKKRIMKKLLNVAWKLKTEFLNVLLLWRKVCNQREGKKNTYQILR